MLVDNLQTYFNDSRYNPAGKP